jgi:hypothetical protein
MEELKPRKANSSPLTPLGFLERATTAYGDYPSIMYDDITNSGHKPTIDASK